MDDGQLTTTTTSALLQSVQMLTEQAKKLQPERSTGHVAPGSAVGVDDRDSTAGGDQPGPQKHEQVARASQQAKP